MRTPIESLLNIKRWKEDEAKNLFANRLKKLTVEEKRLRDLEEQYDSVSKRLGSNTDELINIDEIKKLGEYLELLLIKIHRQEKVIVDKERELEDARRLLTDASKEKKIFERLDEKQKTAIGKEFRRKEQIRTDEHAGAGHHRKKKA
jgi:flagellar FliJ protein